MMNSTAGEDGDFPPNPFRQTPQASAATPVAASQGDLFSGQATPAFAQSPMVVPAPQPVAVPAPLPQGPMTPIATASSPTTTTPVTTTAAPQSRYQACVSCFKMDTYKAYFDVDTIDIANRLKHSILYFYQPDKFRSEIIGVERNDELKGPDLYGPLWITMTLVFFLAVTSNVSDYLRADDAEEFEYDVDHLVHAMSVCFSFTFALPALWWTLTQCMGMQALLMVEWICLYGYSMVPYIPATLLCLVPIHLWMWVVLTVATVVSGALVVRNVASSLLNADATKAGSLLLAVLAGHVIYLLVLKLTFYD